MDENFVSSFELITETKLHDYIPVKKYKSTNTGLNIILGDIDGPIVSGHFFFVTEPSDDHGLPHILEQLISYGSEDYPYKGVLDLVNKKYSAWKNAWTGDDHVFYSIECVGAKSFLSTLPIYMDHILYPMLTDAAFITEVHHITEEGRDGGEIYCGMQRQECTEENRLNMELMKQLYPGTGYAFHCDGYTKKLRESTTNDKIKEFHKKFYRPENLTLIIAGQVDANDIFEALIPIERKFLAKEDLLPYSRPWQTPAPPLSESKLLSITFPDEEEKIGISAIAYRGPSTKTDYFLAKACEIMLGYLGDYPSGSLMREMIEIDDQYATFIYPCAITYQDCLLRFYFRNAPLKNIHGIYEKFFGVLKKIGNGEDPIDMKRIKDVIDNKIIVNCFDLEVLPHTFFPCDIMRHVVHGDEDNFDEWLNSNKIFNELLTKEESFWMDILKTYFIDAIHVYVKAIPSIEEKERLAKEDEIRAEQRRQELGPDGLLELANILKEATEANDVPIPESMIENLPLPTFDNIGRYPINIYRVADGPEAFTSILDQFPIYTEAIDINSNCAYVILSLNTASIPEELRLYLPLFVDLLGKCSVLRDGDVVPFDKVVTQFESDTIFMTKSIGMDDFGGVFSTNVFIDIRIGSNRLHLVPKWLDEILNHSIFDMDRVKNHANGLLSCFVEIKGCGVSIATLMIQSMLYNHTSNVFLHSVLNQKTFLKNLLNKLENDVEAEEVLDNLTTLRSMLLQSHNASLHIGTNWHEIISNDTELVQPFQNLFESNSEVKELRVLSDHDLITTCTDEEPSCWILGSDEVDSSYLHSAVMAFDNHFDPDLSVLMLFCQYFTQDDSPFFHEILEDELAEGCTMEVSSDNGILTFTLNVAKDLPVAFKVVKTLVENHLEEVVNWDPKLLQSAKTSLICSMLKREESLSRAVKEAILSSFKKVPTDYNRTLVGQVTNITQEDLTRVGKIYMHLLFGKKARTAVVCYSDMKQEIQNGFEEFGYCCRIETTLEAFT